MSGTVHAFSPASRALPAADVQAWVETIAARREAYRVLELETARAQATLAAAKAACADAEDAVVRLVRRLGLDETKNWALDGDRVVEIEAPKR